jgi:hypothetical protein
MFLTFSFVFIGGVTGSLFGMGHIVTGGIVGLIISALEKGSTVNGDSQVINDVAYSDGYTASDGFSQALAIAESTDQEDLMVNGIDRFHSIVDGETIVNPATGLLMADGIGGVDMGGSPFGIDSHELDTGFDNMDCGAFDVFSDDCSMDSDYF